MKGYELTPEARDDLQEIWVYIASGNPSAADKLEEEIYAEKPSNWRLGTYRID
jgi:plasmid stabilization system protein ParE